MQTQTQSTLDANQIAKLIDRNNNGYSSLAQAFIALIKDQDLSDGVAVHLFHNTQQIMKQTNSNSAWLLPC